MVRRHNASSAQRIAGVVREVLPDGFGAVAVGAHDRVGVITAHRQAHNV